jgi:hypothetical protein
MHRGTRDRDRQGDGSRVRPWGMGDRCRRRLGGRGSTCGDVVRGREGTTCGGVVRGSVTANPPTEEGLRPGGRSAYDEADVGQPAAAW